MISTEDRTLDQQVSDAQVAIVQGVKDGKALNEAVAVALADARVEVVDAVRDWIATGAWKASEVSPMGGVVTMLPMTSQRLAPAATDTVRLRATGKAVPASPRVEISKVRTWRGGDGYGIEATVKIDGKVAGAIIDEGNGGGEWFRPNSAADRERFELFVATTPGYTETVTYPDGIGDFTLDYSDAKGGPSHEAVCGLLTVDAEACKKLDSALKRGKTPFLRATDDPTTGYRTLNKPDSAEARAWLKANAQADRVWTAEGWVAL